MVTYMHLVVINLDSWVLGLIKLRYTLEASANYHFARFLFQDENVLLFGLITSLSATFSILYFYAPSFYLFIVCPQIIKILDALRIFDRTIKNLTVMNWVLHKYQENV